MTSSIISVFLNSLNLTKWMIILVCTSFYKILVLALYKIKINLVFRITIHKNKFVPYVQLISYHITLLCSQ